MNLESFSGIGAGITGMLLGILGINKYYSVKMTEALDKKQDKEPCIIYHKGIEDKFDTMVKGQERVLDRLDVIYDHLMNGKRINRPD